MKTSRTDGQAEIRHWQQVHDAQDQQIREMQSGLRETNAVREKFSGEMSRLEERKIAVQSDYDGVIRQLLEQYELSLSEAQEQAQPPGRSPGGAAGTAKSEKPHPWIGYGQCGGNRRVRRGLRTVSVPVGTDAGCRDGKAGTGRPHHLADRGDAAHFFGELFHYQPEFPGDLPGSVRRRRGTPGTHRPGKCTGIGHRDQGRTAGKGHQESDLSVRRRTVVCGNRYLFCHSAAAAVSVLYSGRD